MPSQLWYNLSFEDVLKLLNSSPEGLSGDEASRRLKSNGLNTLPKVAPINPWTLLLNQFINPLIYVLLAVVIITALLHHYIDTFVILGIVITNALIGFFQEINAQRSLEKLQDFLAPRCKVLRDGEQHEIDADSLVEGDIVLIEAGTKIPADLRLIESVDLRVDESTLTGEAIPVAKKVSPMESPLPIADRRNMVFSGTFTTSGRGRGVVVATGVKTEFGQIASSMEKASPPPSPLQKQLAVLSRQIVIIVAISTVLLIAIGLLRHLPAVTIFLTGINLAVSVIPEGLPAVLTITLAIGIRRMARQKAIIRYLPAVETLGSASLVASDKTGTLTRNEMVVERIFLDPDYIDVSGDGYIPVGHYHLNNKHVSPSSNPALKKFLLVSTLCNDSSLIQQGNNWKIVGDPTEGALVVLAAKGKMMKPELEENHPRLDEIPFHTAKRYMATLHQYEGGQFIAIKGATEKILPMCTTHYQGKRRHRLSAADRQKFLAVNKELAGNGYRVIMLAIKETNNLEKIRQTDLDGCTLLGLCALSDAPRTEARRAIALAQAAGIRVVMLTGDHALTAQNIASNIGIVSEDSAALPYSVQTGTQIDTMTDKELRIACQNCNIFARISPLNKLELVRHFQKLGYLVAVTGDGINDAPALKQADIGIAMGQTGTDVSRDAADMVLANDNFATIIRAIEEGRTVYQNIKRVLLYLLSTNVGELFVIAATLILGLPLPLQPVQILWVNLITDGFATIPLALEPKHANTMRFPPRSPETPLLDSIVRWRILIVSLTMTVGTVALFAWELHHDGYATARTVAFETMVLFQIINMFNCRSLKDSVFRTPIYNNLYVFWAFIMGWTLTVFAIYLPPLQKIFYTTPLNPAQWLRIIFVSATIILVVEAEKWYRRSTNYKY